MTSFRGTMRIVGDAGPAVPVSARVADQRLVLEVEGTEVGAWPVAIVSYEADREGVVLRLGQERVTIDVSDRAGFVLALRPPTSGGGTRRRLPSLRTVAVALVAALPVVAAVLAPVVAGSVALLFSLIVLVTGTVAYSEPRIALRLPLGLTAVHFLVAGAGLIVVGIPLVLLGG
ncbi:MAG TPA: hypothetical protein VHL52_14430 [Acidimicrobiia bacterium]|nr:hypothetical protein [Acidimicrobiia bacterium]